MQGCAWLKSTWIHFSVLFHVIYYSSIACTVSDFLRFSLVCQRNARFTFIIGHGFFKQVYLPGRSLCITKIASCSWIFTIEILTADCQLLCLFLKCFAATHNVAARSCLFRAEAMAKYQFHYSFICRYTPCLGVDHIKPSKRSYRGLRTRLRDCGCSPYQWTNWNQSLSYLLRSQQIYLWGDFRHCS